VAGEDINRDTPAEQSSTAVLGLAGGPTLRVTLTKDPVREREVAKPPPEELLQQVEALQGTLDDPRWDNLVCLAREALRLGANACAVQPFNEACMRLTHYPLGGGQQGPLTRLVIAFCCYVSKNRWHDGPVWLLSEKLGRPSFIAALKDTQWRLMSCECDLGPGYHVVDSTVYPSQAELFLRE
jgi:hypothetical protein